MIFKPDELFALCESKTNIYIYGAGLNAGRTYHFLARNNIDIKGFVVSDMSDNPESLYGCAVVDVDTFSDDSKYIILAPVFRNNRAYKEIFDCVMSRQIKNVFFLPADLFDIIRQDNFLHAKQYMFHTAQYHLGKNTPVEAKHEIFMMKNAMGQECHWRFPQTMINEQDPESISDFFPDRTALEEFESQYGTYHVLQMDKSVNADSEDTYAVYMARSHVDKAAVPENLPSWMIPIQVGADLTDADICTVKDNTGEHISERNGNYSECTAIYWMWKNAPRTDYIGLCHYRRHFDLDEDDIKRLAALDVDALVTAPSFVYQTIGKFFAELIPTSDMKVMLEVMQKVCPDFVPVAKEFLSSRFYPPCNLFIMKYDLFMEYGEFLFSVAFGIEEYYNSIGFYRKDRYMGFIIECLLGIFLMKKKESLKIAYTDMRFYA